MAYGSMVYGSMVYGSMVYGPMAYGSMAYGPMATACSMVMVKGMPWVACTISAQLGCHIGAAWMSYRRSLDAIWVQLECHMDVA